MSWKRISESLGRKPLVFLYVLIYLPWFFTLEKVVTQYYLMECRLDYAIPFCEYFIVPYVFWFLYVGGSFLWFLLAEKDGLFYRFAAVMFGGMTIALLIYTFFPNGIQLRPNLDASKNVFTWMTSQIYQADTSTNVFPSLHVYTSAVIAMFFQRSELVKKKPVLKPVFYMISGLIIASTVFLKQHSVLDLAAGMVMAWCLYHTAFVDEEEADVAETERRRHRTV